MNIIDKAALLILIIGAVGGGMSGILARIIFTLVGIASLWCISLLFRGEE